MTKITDPATLASQATADKLAAAYEAEEAAKCVELPDPMEFVKANQEEPSK